MKQLLALVAVFMIVGLIIEHWRIIVLVLALVAVAAAAYPLAIRAGEAARRAHRARRDAAARARAERSHLATRATVQHQWYLEGDSRGIYGEYPPADLDRP